MFSKKLNWLIGVVGVPAMVVSAPFKYFNPKDTAAVPKLLSQTGVYNNTTSKQVDTAMKQFSVNAALWSDDSYKTRWVILKPGKKIPYIDTTDFFDYPDSTVFVKTFQMERMEGDTTSRVYLETRLLVMKKETDTAANSPKDWYGFSYRWNAAGTDANLVSIDDGFDTVFFYTPKGRTAQSYKKWRFPSQGNCSNCHRVDVLEGGAIKPRSVLGFYPAQLKKSNTPNNGTDQLIYLFNRGVFSGTQPNAASLARRFKGMKEPIPGSLTGKARWSVIDTMARSYIAANCGGCHGDRGIKGGATGHSGDLNWDWYNFKARQEIGNKGNNSFSLNDVSVQDPLYPPEGRNKYLIHAQKAGLPIGAGQVWDMALPGGVDPITLQPRIVYIGYPALSYALFRQVVRAGAWVDSAITWRYLKNNESFDSVSAERLKWMFTLPWGSQAWRTLLASKGLTMDSIMVPRDYTLYSADNNQMPPLATNIPDTASLRILGEWAKNYYPDSTGTGINSTGVVQALSGPMTRNRTLLIPVDWDDSKGVSMLDVKGRVTILKPLGKRAYQIPASAPSGLYFFKVGVRYFKLSVF